MALETSFRRFGFLPGFIQTGNGEPRKAHWLGNRQSTDKQQEQKQSGNQGPPPQRSDPRGYRSLSSITLGEVEDAYNHFRAQLVPSPVEGWMAKNYFCQLPLNRYSDGPPLIFGRVKTVYPSDGHVHNLEEMEMYFPHADAAPDILHIRAHDLSFERPAQTYCIGVKFYVSTEEMADVSQSENIFLEKGFAPLYENGYLDLLEIHEQNQEAIPWLHVIGSEWFASIPDSVQPEVRVQLREWVRQGNILFNYHPRRHTLRYLSLNEELDFQYGFSEQFLVAPQNTEQTLKKVEESFAEILMRGM
ncbi:MAG TPA: hypothetical protein VFG81_14860 [Anaerolineales bacterium]|jgi:hypothetical protein|nr:hypothetical protein [Anaerolineales bacterium]